MSDSFRDVVAALIYWPKDGRCRALVWNILDGVYRRCRKTAADGDLDQFCRQHAKAAATKPVIEEWQDVDYEGIDYEPPRARRA